ncbi:mRNA interferase MazF [Acetoanaerobium pronyense]|uniref:mRNA interferase MazF n=1 Tax=Acetoanaerobium pronyense TaxID=1482736 RepID=A0ABS4KG12_9FIRM|nr:type II toxin-antitoxin system PemK/MazF family toxin [Acetoanaerobium pronyense]MBP2026717.1 mRNA interferase MazF [Acetoanaerobium pronyense]
MPINIDLHKTQRYLDWMKNKLFIDSNAMKAKGRIVKRGEVYRCNLGMGVGSEECKERPCVILQYDAGNTRSPNTIVAPITHSISTLPIVVPIANQTNAAGDLILDGNVLLGNIVCVSKARLGDYITTLPTNEMKAVDEALAISLDVKRHYDKLMNIHNDKLDYIEKLNNKVEELKSEIEVKNSELIKYEELARKFGFADIESIERFISEKIS